MKFSDEQKQELVALYYNGESVSDICLQNSVPRSTFYTWLKPYQTQVTSSGHIVSANEFIKMKQRIEKLEQKIEVLQKVDCTVSSPLQDKLQELSNYTVNTAYIPCVMHSVFPGVPSTTTSSAEKK